MTFYMTISCYENTKSLQRYSFFIESTKLFFVFYLIYKFILH